MRFKSTNTSFSVKVLKWLSKLYPMAKRGLYRFHGGVFPAYNKSLSKLHPVQPSLIPDELVLPLQQHLGVRAKPIVSVGDNVLGNQLLAETDKGLSAPIHAPTSGTIIAIEPRALPHASGLNDTCIVLKTDGKHKMLKNVLQVDGHWPDTPQQLKTITHQAGIVGMGGAGFPTFAKMPNEKGKIEYLLVNGAECEPFITCDDTLMQTQANAIIKGVEIVAQALGCKYLLCGIEDNKTDAIKTMQQAAQGTQVQIISVQTVYPMGGQAQLTQELTGIEVPADKHAIDVGILMMNVATFAAIYQAVAHGTPLTSRIVTVSGLGVEAPYNITALLGTSFETLAEKAKLKTPLNYPLIKGGPMMGDKMVTNQVPVIKTTNCILASPPEPIEEAMPCIRCGECMDACPVNLLPQQLYWHSRSHEFDKVEKLKVFDCIECGCCSFVCPSKIPLVQYYRFAKSEIKQIKQEEAMAEQAKQRHEFKLARIEKEKQQREARIKAKKDAVKKKAAESSATTNGTSATDKAKAAAAARKKAAANGTAAPESAREKAIAAAKKRAAQASKSKAPKPTLTNEEDKSAKRNAAMEAAKKRAQAKPVQPTPPAEQVNPNTSTDDKTAKRNAAMEAAKKRAQQRKQKTSEEK